jgi:pimeloyl-ACP methyl ester carboxylesterase
VAITARLPRRVAGGLVLVLAACATTPSPSAGPSGPPSASAPPTAAPAAFYNPDPAALATAVPGQNMATLELRAPAGMRAWTVVYSSTGLDGKPVAVSGLVLAPAKAPASGGSPIVAWAHGTTGVADNCAPSRKGVYGIPSELRGLVEQGYVVAATDYQGLGTDGIHPYIVGISEGRSVLDSIRSARALVDAHAGSQVVVIGHSQGGHAALWAGELAPTYAPELHLLGATGTSPPADLMAWETWSYNQAADGVLLDALAPLLIFGVWSQVYDLPLDFLTDAGRASAQTGAASCFPGEIQTTPYLSDPAQEPAWREKLVENSPGGAHTPVPLVVVAARDDAVVVYDSQASGVAALCEAGDTVEFRTVSGDHEDTIWPAPAWSAITGWISDRFAGVAPVSTCPS